MNVTAQDYGVSGVYCAIHRETGKCYVGSSVNVKARMYQHLSEARRRASTAFHRALIALGSDSFDFELLEECPASVMLEREEFYIRLLNARSLDGFNTRRFAFAPNLGRSPGATTRLRLSAAGKGKKRSAAFCARASELRKGKKFTEQHRANISAAMKGKKRGPMSAARRAKLIAAITGRPCSPEARAKMSATQKGRKIPKERVERHRAAMTGRKASPETKVKMAAAAREAWKKRKESACS